jgi:hypothetical protein
MGFGNVGVHAVDGLKNTWIVGSDKTPCQCEHLTFGSALKCNALDTILTQWNDTSDSPRCKEGQRKDGLAEHGEL